MASEAKTRIASGFDISYKPVGDLSKPTILFANGSIFNYKQFEIVYLPKLRSILEPDYSFVLYDYVGYGNSSVLEGEFDFVTIAEQQVEFMDAIGLNSAHLFGLSKGSIISQIVSARYPNRVQSLAGYGSPNLANDEFSKQAKEEFSKRLGYTRSLTGLYQDRITDQNFDLVYDTIYVPTVFGKQVFNLGLFERIKNFWLKRKLKPLMMGPKIEIMEKLFSYYLEEITAEEKQRYVDGLQTLDVPSLLIHGTADETVPPSSSELLAEWIPDARLELIEGYSHSSPTLISWKGKKIMKIYAEFLRDLEQNP